MGVYSFSTFNFNELAITFHFNSHRNGGSRHRDGPFEWTRV